ncbi:unnamed protein product [Rotaria sordida]|uniref:Peptidase M12B domain-containing protein n=1 Tax=Rotaria sordida TaxID=392033 RepID=A0A814I3D5_9BILA|nr:unnamed protein product [Rotaria sordida]CAF1068439.1 unnamed protein product [Rotaria sordida]CAF1117812.1 unnamed protein product [Rotaria sordida]CAF3580002.1 unnamed protein product [Rotaria sordida]CAF3779649.1 unnamed protein product [Rotaria sordida]
MARLNQMITVIIVLTLCTIGYLNGFSLSRLFSSETYNRVKRADGDDPITRRIQTVGNLVFDSNVTPTAKISRKIACFFVFDKEASADLNNSLSYAKKYATQLATLASKYTIHANIKITNAGTEIWSNGDQISFPIGTSSYIAMPDILTKFQTYLANTQKSRFGTVYAVGVLISNKTLLVAGGYSQGPICTTSGASLINYRQYPWSIAGLLAHELAHTLSVVHPFELSYLCDEYKTKLKFCTNIPEECLCTSNNYPAQQCLMTYQFGRATPNAPKYTSCDIEMMNYFAANSSCLTRV